MYRPENGSRPCVHWPPQQSPVGSPSTTYSGRLSPWDSGISRACPIGGQSEHTEGRAWDWGVYVGNPAADQVLEHMSGIDAARRVREDFDIPSIFVSGNLEEITPEPTDDVPVRRITLNVNGKNYRLRVEPRITLLRALRNDLDLTGTKEICDLLARIDVTDVGRRELVNDLVEANLAVARSIELLGMLSVGVGAVIMTGGDGTE